MRKAQKLTGYCKLSQKLIRVGSLEPLFQAGCRELSSDDWSYVERVVLIEYTMELERLLVSLGGTALRGLGT
jgi:hypothetical protein